MSKTKQILGLYSHVLGISAGSTGYRHDRLEVPQTTHRYRQQCRKMFSHTCSSVPVTLYLQYVFQIATLKASRPTGSSLLNPGVNEKGGENSLHKPWVQWKFIFIQQFTCSKVTKCSSTCNLLNHTMWVHLSLPYCWKPFPLCLGTLSSNKPP